VHFFRCHEKIGERTQYANPAYAGESKFAMARLSDPFDIIRPQAEAQKELDLEQIIAFYDACVARFDDESTTSRVRASQTPLSAVSVMDS